MTTTVRGRSDWLRAQPEAEVVHAHGHRRWGCQKPPLTTYVNSTRRKAHRRSAGTSLLRRCQKTAALQGQYHCTPEHLQYWHIKPVPQGLLSSSACAIVYGISLSDSPNEDLLAAY